VRYHIGPALGELRTTFAEVFGIFSWAVLDAAEDARAEQSRVLLDVRTSAAGHRYVKGIKALDTSIDPTPCLRCGTLAPKVEHLLIIHPTSTETLSSPHYTCPLCHALWFLEPIGRIGG